MCSSVLRKKSASLDPEIEELERQREALQRDICELRIEHDLLKAASELVKKGSWRRSAGSVLSVTGQSAKSHADRRPKKSV